MLINIIKPDFSFDDERGRLVQLAHQGYSQFNIIFSNRDAFRGGHYHKDNTEVFYVVSGSFKMEVTWNGCTEEYIFREGDMFLVPPNVVHSFYYLEDTYVAAMYDLGVVHANGSMDIYKQGIAEEEE